MRLLVRQLSRLAAASGELMRAMQYLGSGTWAAAQPRKLFGGLSLGAPATEMGGGAVRGPQPWANGEGMPAVRHAATSLPSLCTVLHAATSFWTHPALSAVQLPSATAGIEERNAYFAGASPGYIRTLPPGVCCAGRWWQKRSACAGPGCPLAARLHTFNDI